MLLVHTALHSDQLEVNQTSLPQTKMVLSLTAAREPSPCALITTHEGFSLVFSLPVTLRRERESSWVGTWQPAYAKPPQPFTGMKRLHHGLGSPGHFYEAGGAPGHCHIHHFMGLWQLSLSPGKEILEALNKLRASPSGPGHVTDRAAVPFAALLRLPQEGGHRRLPAEAVLAPVPPALRLPAGLHLPVLWGVQVRAALGWAAAPSASALQAVPSVA